MLSEQTIIYTIENICTWFPYVTRRVGGVRWKVQKLHIKF